MLTSYQRFALLLCCVLAVLALGAAAAATPDFPVRTHVVSTMVPDMREPRPTATAQTPVERLSLGERLAAPARMGRGTVAGGASLLLRTQIVSFYGNPYSQAMGVLGEGTPESAVARLGVQAARYDRINGPLGVTPALHLVYAVAQRRPGSDGLFLQYVDDATVRRYIDLAEEYGLLLFLDLQIGRSTVRAEVERVSEFLRHPRVHLALDPEFAVEQHEVPGIVLGTLYAEDVNEAQMSLATIVRSEGLQSKMLIVHQFADSMLPDAPDIETYPGVDVVIDVDGYGRAEIKQAKYERYAARSPEHLAGIKLFFRQDPDLMSEADVLALDPQPSVIIYQ